MSTRVTSPKPQEIEAHSHDETIEWRDICGVEQKTKYRFLLKGQQKKTDERVDTIADWIFREKEMHYILIPKRKWAVLTNEDQLRLESAIQEFSCTAFGAMSGQTLEVMHKQFPRHDRFLSRAAQAVFSAMRYAAKGSPSKSSKIYYQIDEIRYRIDCHIKKGCTQLFFVGDEIAHGQQCTVFKMVIMNIPKKLSELKRAFDCVYYQSNKPVREKEQLRLAQEKLTRIQLQSADPKIVTNVQGEIDAWTQAILSRKQCCRQSLARGVEVAALLKERHVPHVLEYLGHEMKDGKVIGAMAEMCDSDAMRLLPWPCQRLSPQDIQIRLSILDNIAEALSFLHHPHDKSFRTSSSKTIFCVCDLKTENIFLKGNEALIGDFAGIVKEGEPVNEFSRAYAAPGKDIGTGARHEDDIYALGVIGCELFHGRIKGVKEACSMLTDENPLDLLLKAMLQKEPLLRPSAFAIREWIQRLLGEIVRTTKQTMEQARGHLITIGQARTSPPPSDAVLPGSSRSCDEEGSSEQIRQSQQKAWRQHSRPQVAPSPSSPSGVRRASVPTEQSPPLPRKLSHPQPESPTTRSRSCSSESD